MSKQKEKMPVRFKRLDSVQGTDYCYERSLDLIFSPGCFTVEIEHSGKNVGLPMDYCGEEHYFVGNLVVTDSGTAGYKQESRVIGQLLTISSRNGKETKVFTRTFADGLWSQWSSLARTGMYDNISTTDELVATVAGLVDETKRIDTIISSEAILSGSLQIKPSTKSAEVVYRNLDGTKTETITLPVATATAAGLMSAEDKGGLEKLITFDYADNSYTAGKWVEENGRIVAASSSSYAKYSPIPVCGGQKIVYSAASGSDNIPLYITDKDGVVIYSTSRMNGEIYAPSEAAFIYITSTIAGYSCVVYGVYDTYSYRAQKLDKLIGEDIALPLNGYYTATGAWQESSGYYCTEKIAVSENSGVETNATYIACWDINGKWLGRNTENDGSIWEGTKYIAIFGQSDGYYLRFNNNYCNIPTQEDIHILTRSVASLAEERTSVDTIDYSDNPYQVGIWLEQDGKVVEGTSSVYARYNPIPVHSGQKIKVTAAAGPNDNTLFITDKEGNIIYSKAGNITLYAPDGAAMLYITSTISAYSCVVYGVYDTYSYRAQKLDKLIGESITFPLNGYYTATGAWQESSGYYCTEKIAVSENSGVETNATYIACWDINGKWLGRNAGKDGILEGTKYIAIYGQNDGYYLRFNSDYCNIPTQEDMHSLSRSIESLAGGIKGIVGIDAEMSDSIALANNNVTVIEGVAGEAGARYSVPIAVKGSYGITIKFRMPDDLHTSVYERELASFGTRASSSTNGFSVDIKSVLPTNDLSQLLCKSSLGFYPTNSKTNNYAGRFDIEGRTEREFVGDVAFSLRYTGSLEGNEDIAYTLGENALRIYHTTTDVDVLNVPYPEDNLITSLLDALNVNTETVEAIGYSAENITLDSIIKCSAIPLIGTYEGTTDAFPSFVLLKDDTWHTLEVRFDASKGKGLDMIAGYIDGRRFYHIDNGYKLYGDGYFKSELTFGCDGVAVKSIKVAPTLKSEIPNIVALCQHSINGDEKFNSTVTSGTNLSVTYGRTEELLRVFKKYGFKYVTSEQINGYLRRGEVLPHNCFTIIHDDYHYLRENAEKEYARDIRKLYLRNGIKAAFGIIPIDGYLSEETAAECIKDKDVFEFLIHDDYTLSSSKGYQAIADRIVNNISNFKSKLYTSNIWVYTGGVFDANTKMMLQASGISIAYYTSGTTTSGGICDASDRLGLPRLYCNDTGTTISELEEILSNLVKH